ncbi:MAG: hypothetical protein CVU00_15380 [Bacteroidetes bacterium HGW-Bacteroidetes-17]|nr:MAG: hypothetical protein CVU00_15380 [Bacteroidetes bacterium HGW-Bacteroidetes-17]
MKISKNLFGIAIIIMISLSGCMKHESTLPKSDRTMDNLNVPDGFNFKSVKEIEIEINMPDSVDFSVLRSRFDIFTSDPEEGGKLINSASFDTDGHYKGIIRVPTSINEIFIKTIAGNVMASLPIAGQKSSGVIIDFGDNYGYQAPDTVVNSIKSQFISLNQLKQTYAGTNIIGNGDFNSNDFGGIAYWSTLHPVDQKWYFTNYYYYGTMEWFNDGGNGRIRTPLRNSNGSAYSGGASQWINATAGDVITLTADIKSDGGSNLYSYLYLIPRNSNGTVLAYYNLYYSNPSTNWKTKTLVASMPYGTATCQVLLWNNDYNNNSRIYYDNVIVTGPVTDADGDGVSDEDDDYPNDATRAFNIYYPDANTMGSFAFEDNWPGKGDYDFNDVVVDYQYKQIVNSANKLVDLEARFKFKASGATFLNGFGFQMGLNPAAIASVTGTSITDGYLSILGNGSEAGQTKGTIIVTDNVFNQIPNPGGGIGTNTTTGATYVEPVTLTIKLATVSPVAIETAGRPPYNPFIIVNEDRGREVHLADYPPTNLANNQFFGIEHDDSNIANGKYYKTQNNLPWGIETPTPFDYPVEKAQIINAHLKFADWAESGGTTYTDWYENLSGYRNPTNIFQIPN